MNIGGLAFLMLTWQQLLGGAASHFQTTLTLVGGAFSLAVIVALALARRTQIEKFRADMEATGKMMPTEEEVEKAEYVDSAEEEVETESVVKPDISDESEFYDSEPEPDTFEEPLDSEDLDVEEESIEDSDESEY
ncbi:MAG: hypothetical protein ACW977_06635 [Candidatus Thorarchaeota archaeon]|jgi:hypothetical protein